MVDIARTALVRTPKLRVKNIRIQLANLLRAAGFRQATRYSMSRLSDHLARDIGLDGADLERHRMQLPSRTTRHPML